MTYQVSAVLNFQGDPVTATIEAANEREAIHQMRKLHSSDPLCQIKVKRLNAGTGEIHPEEWREGEGGWHARINGLWYEVYGSPKQGIKDIRRRIAGE